MSDQIVSRLDYSRMELADNITSECQIRLSVDKIISEWHTGLSVY